MANRYYWLKLLRDFYSNPYIEYLKTTNAINGRMLITIYQEIMLLTLSSDGILENLPMYPSIEDYIAITCNEKLEDVRNTISYFSGAGLLELIDKNTLFCPYVCENTGSKTDSAIRMAKARTKKKLEAQNIQLLETSHCDGAVSQCDKNVTQSIDIEIDIEKENINKLLKKYKEKTGKHNNILLTEKEYLYLAQKLVYPQVLIDDVSEWIFKNHANPTSVFGVITKFLEKDKVNRYMRIDNPEWQKLQAELLTLEKRDASEIPLAERIAFCEKYNLQYDPVTGYPNYSKTEKADKIDVLDNSNLEKLENIINSMNKDQFTDGIAEYIKSPSGFNNYVGKLVRETLNINEEISLYEYIIKSELDEITVWDNDYDIETYFYKRDPESNDEWDIAMEELSKLLIVKSIKDEGVIVNLSQLIEDRMREIKEANLFFDGTDIDDVMEDIEAILAGDVSEKWLVKFVDALKPKHPDICYALRKTNKVGKTWYGDMVTIKWGEAGYYKNSYENKYTQDEIDHFNEKLGVTKAEAEAMELCSMVENLENWDEHYKKVLKTLDDCRLTNKLGKASEKVAKQEQSEKGKGTINQER